MRKLWLAPLCAAALLAGAAQGSDLIPTDVGMMIQGDKVAEFAAELEKRAANVEFGQEALRSAVLSNAPGIVKLLLDKGVDVDASNSSGATALHLAAKYGRLAIVKALLDKNADVNVKAKGGETPLHEAINAKDPAKNPGDRRAIVKLLLDKGAGINAAAATGVTPFMLAYSVKPFDQEVAAAALAAKPEVNAQDNAGKTALWHCVQSHATTTLNAHDESEWKIPAALSDVPGVNVNLADKAGETPVHYLAANVRKENALPLIKHLAAKGADLNARNRSGKTALLLAIEGRRYDVMNLLLELKADANLADNEGMSPAIKAAWDGELEVLKTLVDGHGAELNVQTKNRMTPLLYAATGSAPVAKRLAVIQYLLSKNLSADQRKTALLYLTSHRRDADSVQIAKMLIDNGADVDGQDFKGNSPLHYAVSGRSRNLAVLLLNAKANVNAANKEGKTPLFNAASVRDTQMIQLLLKNGADKAVKDQKGKTAADYASGDAKKMLE